MSIPVVMGLFRGFFRTVFSIAGSLAGVALAIVFSRSLGNEVATLFGLDEVIGRIIAFSAILGGCWIAGLLLGFFFRKVMSTLKLGWLDRMLGGILGFFKGAILVAAVLIIMTRFPNFTPLIEGSCIVPILIKGSHKIISLLPRTWDCYLDPGRWLGQVSEPD